MFSVRQSALYIALLYQLATKLASVETDERSPCRMRTVGLTRSRLPQPASTV